MSFVFDELVVLSAAGVESGTVGRPEGPIEAGHFDGAGAWVFEEGPQQVLDSPGDGRAGFGVDGTGPYFDAVGVGAGEGAALWVDPSTGQVWLGDRN